MARETKDVGFKMLMSLHNLASVPPYNVGCGQDEDFNHLLCFAGLADLATSFSHYTCNKYGYVI